MNLPPLRERQADVLPLASMILERFAPAGGEAKQLSHEAAELLLRYPWPGNIRELFNVMEHAAVLTDGDFIEPADLPPHLSDAAFSQTVISDVNLESVERRTIVEALRRTRNNRAEASRMLGIEPRRLNRRIRALNIPFGKSTVRHSRI
jgi:DNA-binding NtrC family response regulator